jgi:Trk K+ transport system NAD-binding subunit
LTVLTVVGGVLAFRLEAAERGDTMSFAEALYSTLGLFAFAGNRFGFPQTSLLVAVYFLAPYITASALLEAVLRVLHERNSLLLAGMRGHTVICGAGNLGLLLADEYERSRTPTVLVNDKAPDAEEDTAALVVIGDMTRESVLRDARAETAGRVYLTAGDDLVNLEVATRLARRLASVPLGTGPMVYCHIGDATLRDTLLDADGPRRVNYFNSYRLSAKALVARMFAEGWIPEVEVAPGTYLGVQDAGFGLRGTIQEDAPRVAVVVGLGRFGRAVAEQLADLLPRDCELWVVDSHKPALDGTLARVSRHRAARGWLADVADGEWGRAAEAYGKRALVLLCTDKDRANLRVAMGLSRSVRTVVRMFDQEFGERFQDVSVDRRELDVAGFRGLFHDALPMLAYQQDVDGPHGRMARIRTCLRLPGKESARWYLAWLHDRESSALAGRTSADAQRVASLPATGVDPTNVPGGWWLVRSAVFEALAAGR